MNKWNQSKNLYISSLLIWFSPYWYSVFERMEALPADQFAVGIHKANSKGLI